MGKKLTTGELQPSVKKHLPIIEFIFIILASLYYSNYIIQASYGFQIMIASTIYVVYCYIMEKRYRKTILTFMTMLVLFSLLYLVLTDTLSIGDYVSNRNLKRFISKYSQYLLMFTPVFMFYRTATQASRKQTLIIMGVISLNFIILARTAIAAASIEAESLHTFVEESVEGTGLLKSAFYYVYAYTFTVLTGWICFKYAREKTVRYVSLGVAFFSIYLLFTAQYALSLVTTFLSLLYVYISGTRNSRKRFWTIIAVFAIIMMSPLIIKGVMSISNSRIINVRLAELYDIITGENISNGTDGQGRLELYWMCIQAFFSSPIIGNRTLPLDGHATLLTVPADIGIYGVIFLYAIFKNSYKVIASVLGEKKFYFKPLMFQIVLMGLTNPIHSSPSIYINLFFLCPLAIMVFIKR